MITNLPSRYELLNWIGHITNTTVEKYEHLSDGVLFCQVFDKMYPKVIPLHKLKRDSKLVLDKEKNFKILLNAISQMDLPLTINIVDLSHGKVPSLLELMQWFFKEYNKVSNKSAKSQAGSIQRRMIKSYVGSLVVPPQQKNLNKENPVNQSSNDLASSRRSLDSKLLQKKMLQNEGVKSARSNKSLQKSQVKEKTSKKKKESEIKKVIPNQQRFQEICREQILSKKKNLGEEKKQETFQQVLKKTLQYDRSKIKKALINVSKEVLQSNPELKSKLKNILQKETQEEEKTESQDLMNQSPIRRPDNIFASNTHTSFSCQNDTIEDIQSEKPDNQETKLQAHQNCSTPFIQESIISVFSNSQKKDSQFDRKQTTKKSSVKIASQKKHDYPAISANMIRQISAQKERAQKNHLFPSSQNDQNRQMNIFAPQNSNVFDPHIKSFNPEAIATEKKPHSKKEFETHDNSREVQSENSHTNASNTSNSSGYFIMSIGQKPNFFN